TFFDNYQGTLLALLPPGAFIGLGLIVALKNLVDQRKISSQPAVSVDTVLKTQTT
ncbi:MAG: electron transport complex subunit RsxE, partial [Candidatus Thioglobus sp.]|nr:electron transport complex subunit RsxE [Candidatus Thioglobus sp.]